MELITSVAPNEPDLKLLEIVNALCEATQIHPQDFNPTVHFSYAQRIVYNLLKMEEFTGGLEVSIGYYKARRHKGNWGVEEVRLRHFLVFQDPRYIPESLETFVGYDRGRVLSIGTIQIKHTQPIRIPPFSISFYSENKIHMLVGANM